MMSEETKKLFIDVWMRSEKCHGSNYEKFLKWRRQVKVGDCQKWYI